MSKLKAQYGSDTKQIIETYRRAMPNASPTDIFVAVASMTMMGLGSVEIAEKKVAQKGSPLYLYHFGYKSELKVPGTDFALGTPHAMGITFKFYNESLTECLEYLSGNRPERLIASHHMAELWTTFARTGSPAVVGLPAWPAYNLNERPSMRIDTNCEVINNRFSEELAMWCSIGILPVFNLPDRISAMLIQGP